MRLLSILCFLILNYACLSHTLKNLEISQTKIQDLQTIDSLRQLRVETPSNQQNEGEIYLVLTNERSLSAKTRPAAGDTVCAYAKFEDTLKTLGWHQLSVEAEGKCGRLGTMYAAGWVEGYVSYDKIIQYYQNYISTDAELMQNLPELKQVLQNVYGNTLENIQKEKDSSDQKKKTFWNGIELFAAQFEGVAAGFLSRSQKLDREDIMLINSNGELGDLLDALPTFLNQDQAKILTQQSSRESKKRVSSQGGFLQREYSLEEAHELRIQKLFRSHCSAFIKLLRDENGHVKDVLASHGTWDSFIGMLKVMKKYNLKVQTTEGQSATEYKLLFPSYAGSLTSQDDFYVSQSGLVLMETSLNVFNNTIYEESLNPSTYLPTFLKLAASNYLGKTAHDWVENFGFINTNTYNSQWMVLDFQSVKDSIGKSELKPGSFYVMEQIPGLLITKDMTDTLNTESYWSSFNMPVFDETYERSGAKAVYQQTRSDDFSRTQDPRAVLFRELQGDVKNIQDLKKLIRLNTVEKNGGAQLAQIAPRYDLSDNGDFFGETDAKITSYTLAKDIGLIAVGGPTKVESGAFSFPDDIYDSLKGMPQTWDFEWRQHTFKQ